MAAKNFRSHICRSSQFRIIGYLPPWISYPSVINNVDLTKVTHVNISFSYPDSTGALILANGTDADLDSVVTVAHAYNVKVLLTIGGDAAIVGNIYHALITTNQAGFVNSIVNYAVNHNLDGIDVDIEGDILDGSILTSAQYENFITQLGALLHAQNKIMT